MIESKDGTITFLCGRQHVGLCFACGAEASYACDYPVDEWGNSCDVDMCKAHATVVGWNRHYCEAHVRVAQAQ